MRASKNLVSVDGPVAGFDLTDTLDAGYTIAENNEGETKQVVLTTAAGLNDPKAYCTDCALGALHGARTRAR